MMKIGWSCGIDASGYSSAARSYIKALHENKKCKVNVIVFNIAKNINLNGIDKKEINFISSISQDNFNNLDFVITHSVPDRMIFSNKRKNILYTICEMDVPKRWIDICNSCDLIFTASNFSRNKFLESGVKEDKIKIIPHCHDCNIWNPSVSSLNIKNKTDFNFLFMADYTPRKGGDMLIKSFLKAFEGSKTTSLTIKSYYNSFSKKDQKNLANRILKVVEDSGIPENRRPKIFFYGNPIEESLMPRFMNSFDCLVSPHRGEGWGLALSQMMFLGKPVIATNYSGNLEFMNKSNSFLIETNGFEDVCEEMANINPNFKGQSWVKIDEDSLVDQMKFVVENREIARDVGMKAYQDMKSKFSYNIASNKIIKYLSELNENS